MEIDVAGTSKPQRNQLWRYSLILCAAIGLLIPFLFLTARGQKPLSLLLLAIWVCFTYAMVCAWGWAEHYLSLDGVSAKGLLRGPRPSEPALRKAWWWGRQFRYSIVALILCPIFESFLVWQSERPTELIPGFWSWSSEEAVRQQLKDYKIELATDQKRKKKVHYRGLRIVDYSHLGIQGELGLAFHDGRLFRMDFYPRDPQAYFARLRSTFDLPVERTQLAVSRHTHVERFKDYRGKTYVYWEDKYLAEEFWPLLD